MQPNDQTLDQDQDRASRRKEFFIDDYRTKVQYLIGQFDRMWHRFQLLLVVQTGLAGLFLAALLQRPAPARILAVLGILISLWWYLVGAEDKYLVELYRQQILVAFDHVRRALRLEPTYYRVGQTENISSIDVGMSPFRFRLAAFSITTLVVVFPLLLLAFWIVMLLPKDWLLAKLG